MLCDPLFVKGLLRSPTKRNAGPAPRRRVLLFGEPKPEKSSIPRNLYGDVRIDPNSQHAEYRERELFSSRDQLVLRAEIGLPILTTSLPGLENDDQQVPEELFHETSVGGRPATEGFTPWPTPLWQASGMSARGEERR